MRTSIRFGTLIHMNVFEASALTWLYSSEQVAPEIDLNEFPPHKFIKSVHNTVIEGFWSWLRKKRGLKMKEALIQGREEGRFFPNNPLHMYVDCIVRF